MKIWKKYKHPILICLIVLLFAFVHLLVVNLSLRINSTLLTLLITPLLRVYVVSLVTTDSCILLDILLAAIAIPCVIAVAPMPQKRGRLRRYLLRPMQAILVLAALHPQLLGGWISEQLYHGVRAPYYWQIQRQFDAADASVTFGGSHCSQVLHQYLPDLTYKGKTTNEYGWPTYYAKGAVLVDFDSPSVTFFFRGDSTHQARTFSLSTETPLPDKYDRCKHVLLDGPVSFLEIYMNRINGSTSDYVVTCIAVTLPNGTVYATNETIDPLTGKHYDIGSIISYNIGYFTEGKQSD